VGSSPSRPDAIGVAVPVPGLGLLTYRLPPGLPVPAKGARVAVPLGTRTVVGCVVESRADAPAGTDLRDVAAVLDDEAFLPADIVDLALWVGEFYACGPGDALTVAMPPSARRGEPDAFRMRTRVLASDTPLAAAPRGAKQRALLTALAGRADGVLQRDLAAAGITPDVVRRAASAGLVRLVDEIDERDPFSADQGNWASEVIARDDRPLTDQQQAAHAALTTAADTRTFKAVLLHGVTGSGKTEVYLRVARDVIASRRRVLVLVPEIALTPALAGIFRSTFGERVAVQHSGLSEGERHDQWHRIRRGAIDLVVGTRSAVFAPLDSVGLIVVDEEHESSYKQDETPRYHARDVAVMRARMDGALVVLGSATPSMESASNAEAGRYELVRMTRRVLDRPLATVRLVDMRKQVAITGAESALSEPLVEAMGRRLAQGEQSLVLLNRRGFATVIFCRECGASLECPHCSVTLTYHRAARRVRCHYCNYSAHVPRACGECGGAFLEHSGVGTERLEAEVRERFPQARVARVDRDTIRRRGAITRVLAAVARGDLDIVVGTQMIAKGHDFPAVTLVGVVAADVGLGLADFRASERTFQLLTQVVGRAGRGEVPGEAIVQTLYPEHYSVQAAARQDYAAFYAREMEFRQAMFYPPTLAMVNVVVRHRSLDRAMADAADLVARVRQRKVPARILGPAPAALARIKDEYRAQFFLKGRQRRPMREALLAALAERPDLRKRTIVDVDPVSVT
jgi:primosomal protein N' (replication factor Y)